MTVFDIHLYKSIYNKPSEHILFDHMTENLEVMIDLADAKDLPTLCSYRTPVSVARMAFQQAIAADMDEGQALYTAVAAYEDRRDDFIIRSEENETLHQADQKRARGEKLTPQEMHEEMRAFLAKRECS